METAAAIDRFLAAPRSPRRRAAYGGDLRDFGGWLEGRGVDVDDVDVRVLAEYAAELEPVHAAWHRRRSPAGSRPFAPFSASRSGRREFPTHRSARAGLQRLPEAPKREEIEAIVDALGATGPSVCATARSSSSSTRRGCGAPEAVGLDLADVDFEQEQVRVRGKGGKERVVPLGEEASHHLARYLETPGRSSRVARTTLFLSARGRRLDTSTLRRLLPHPHRLRHSFATHLLEGGADRARSRSCSGIRRSTTQCTAMWTRGVRRVYNASHPRS